jgi:hypothetical protein
VEFEPTQTASEPPNREQVRDERAGEGVDARQPEPSAPLPAGSSSVASEKRAESTRKPGGTKGGLRRGPAVRRAGGEPIRSPQGTAIVE